MRSPSAHSPTANVRDTRFTFLRLYTGVRHQGMSKRTIGCIYGIIALYTFAPILCILFCSAVSTLTGIHLEQGPVYFLGVDVAGLLTTIGTCGWYAMVTLPTGLIAMAAFTFLWIVLLVLQKRGVGKA